MGVHGLLYQMKWMKTSVCAKRGPQHFDDLNHEHLLSEVIRNTLKVRVILKKMLIPFVEMANGRVGAFVRIIVLLPILKTRFVYDKWRKREL